MKSYLSPLLSVSGNLSVLQSKQAVQSHVCRRGSVLWRQLGHLSHCHSLCTVSCGDQMAHEMKKHCVRNGHDTRFIYSKDTFIKYLYL